MIKGIKENKLKIYHLDLSKNRVTTPIISEICCLIYDM